MSIEVRAAVAEIRNDTMNFAAGVTLAAPALAFAETSGCRRMLWPASKDVRGVNSDG